MLQQQANFFIRDDTPFRGDVAAAAPEFRFSSCFNVSGGGAVEYDGAMQQPPAKYVDPTGSTKMIELNGDEESPSIDQ
uniref:Uncharacterized protein n=1 Tax=Oryza brachyantha TaxID=4533 RepID=J3LVV7_ORYBR